MDTYKVISGKHHIPEVKGSRVTIKTYPPGETFEAEVYQVKNILDKVKLVKSAKEEEGFEAVKGLKKKKKQHSFSRSE